MKKTMTVLLALVMMLSAVPPAVAEQMYPTNVKNGQVLSDRPYKVVETYEGLDIFNVYTYLSWERMDEDLIVHWVGEEINFKTGKVNQSFPCNCWTVDYFKQKNNQITTYNSPIALPPVWDRPLTDPQATKLGKPKVINWLYDCRFHWASKQIFELYDKKIFACYPDGSFRPENKITREEFVSILVNAMGLTKRQTSDFTDVPLNSWSNKAIGAALQNSIILVEDYPDKKFEPQNYITREEIAVMLVRALKKDPANTTADLTFKDKDCIKNPGYISLAVELKLVSGYPDGNFRPDGQATRAEAAAVIDNFLAKKIS